MWRAPFYWIIRVSCWIFFCRLVVICFYRAPIGQKSKSYRLYPGKSADFLWPSRGTQMWEGQNRKSTHRAWAASGGSRRCPGGGWRRWCGRWHPAPPGWSPAPGNKIVQCKKGPAIFPSPAGMSLTNVIVIPAGDGKVANLFLLCSSTLFRDVEFVYPTFSMDCRAKFKGRS